MRVQCVMLVEAGEAGEVGEAGEAVCCKLLRYIISNTFPTIRTGL